MCVWLGGLLPFAFPSLSLALSQAHTHTHTRAWKQRVGVRESWLDRFKFTPDRALECRPAERRRDSTWPGFSIPISLYWQPDKRGQAVRFPVEISRSLLGCTGFTGSKRRPHLILICVLPFKMCIPLRICHNILYKDIIFNKANIKLGYVGSMTVSLDKYHVINMRYHYKGDVKCILCCHLA